MDDDVREALDELRDEMRTLGKARTPAARASAREDVREAREDLDDVLRREGYHLSRREIDSFVAERDERRIAVAVDKRLAELAADDKDEGEVDEDGKKKPAAKKPAAKKPAAKDGETEEEWT